MIVAIADTHATIWYLFSDPRLGKAASAFIDDTIASGDHIGVSAITIADMVYLIEKGRIPPSALNDLHAATADSAAVLRHVPFDENIALKMTEVPRQELPDLPDRVIGATALFYSVPVLSRDSRIRSSRLRTIW
ncbi:MAG: PIN domain-containing protein [Acidobacteriaceae bacterium]